MTIGFVLGAGIWLAAVCLRDCDRRMRAGVAGGKDDAQDRVLLLQRGRRGALSNWARRRLSARVRAPKLVEGRANGLHRGLRPAYGLVVALERFEEPHRLANARRYQLAIAHHEIASDHRGHHPGFRFEPVKRRPAGA
jgi:hypothetical protein